MCSSGSGKSLVVVEFSSGSDRGRRLVVVEFSSSSSSGSGRVQ